MARELKVYGWTGYDPANVEGHNKQTREIVAAHSVAEVLRVAGIPRSTYAWSGCDTGNRQEIELAMSEPGVVFFRPLDARYGDNSVWKRRESR